MNRFQMAEVLSHCADWLFGDIKRIKDEFIELDAGLIDFLIERRESHGTRYYSHIGTGNFNEKTARLYTDFTLLTWDQNIGADVAEVFDFLKYTYRRPEYRLLLVS